MKRLFLVLIGFALVAGCAVAPVADRTVSDVVDLPGMKKDQAYTKTLEFFAKNFVSANDVIQMKDKETGMIVGQIVTSYTKALSNVDVDATMTVELKDSRARITYVAHTMNVSGTGKRAIYQGEQAESLAALKKMTEKYVAFMNTKASSDW